MNYTLAIVTLLLLLYLIIYQIKLWKLRVALSPAFYFAIIWSFGVIGCLVLAPVDLLYEPYPQYIDELNMLISFTSICFISFTHIGYKKVNKSSIFINFCTWKTFRILAVIFAFAALIDFIRLGANFSVGSARQNLAEITSGRSAWIGYCQLFSLPLSLYAGFKIVSVMSGYIKTNFVDKFFLILPLLSNLVFSLNVGGRVDFVYAFAQYLIGFALGLPITNKLSLYRKYVRILVVSCIGVILFISAVSKVRSEYVEVTSESRSYLEQMNPIIGAVYGPIEYIIASYNGYQLRRVDAVDENQFGYGKYTFNGFINWEIPFASKLGIKEASIAKAFDIYYDNQETYDHKRELYYTTHSCYLTMIKDYGFVGSLFCILFLTYVAHYLFISIQCRTAIKYSCQLFFFFLFWNYWAKSNFYGTLSSSVLVPLYGFILVDMVNLFLKKK